MQPGNPKVLLAGMWQFRRFPWEFVGGGPGSGIWKSTDGGATWKKLEKDMPEGPLGRISIAIAPTNANHVYALIHSKKGILFDSKDLGEHWEKLTDNRTINVRPWYFSRHRGLAGRREQALLRLVQPRHVRSTAARRSRRTTAASIPTTTRSGSTRRTRTASSRARTAARSMSTDGGKTWRPFDNLPLGQFYQVAIEHGARPTRSAAGSRTTTAWCGASNSLAARRHRRTPTGSWSTGGDGEYAVPAPSDPNIVYADSQNGNIIRLRPEDEALAQHPAVPLGRPGDGAGGPEVPLQLDVPDRRLGDRRQRGLPRRQRRLQVDGRRARTGRRSRRT